MNTQQNVAFNVIETALKSLTPSESQEVIEVLSKTFFTSQDGQLTSRKSADKPSVLRPGRPSKIDKDPEVEQFLLSLEGCYLQKEMRQLCIDKFGKARAPSQSGLHRFIKKTQKQLNRK